MATSNKPSKPSKGSKPDKGSKPVKKREGQRVLRKRGTK